MISPLPDCLKTGTRETIPSLYTTSSSNLVHKRCIIRNTNRFSMETTIERQFKKSTPFLPQFIVTLVSTVSVLLMTIVMIMRTARGESVPLLPPSPDPPCSFNPLCTCSKPGPDLGKVLCQEVPLFSIPPILNSSMSIYILSLDRNSLLKVEDRSFYGTGISRLEITFNHLSTLSSQSFFGLERTLRELNLEGNRLSSVPRGSLSRLQRLRHLNLNHNQISELRSHDMDFPTNLRSSLKLLSLAGNSLTYIDQYSFSSLWSLQHLDLSGNNIFALHQLAFAVGGGQLSGSDGGILTGSNFSPASSGQVALPIISSVVVDREHLGESSSSSLSFDTDRESMARRRRSLSTTRKRRKKRDGSLGNYVTTREEPYATPSFLGGDNSSFPASTVESSPLSLSSTSSSFTDFRQVPPPSAEYLRSSSSSSLPYLSSTTKVTFLPSLEYVNLNNNRLKKIPFEAIQNLSTGATNSLKVLDLRSNVITATSDMIDYKGKKLSLESLYLDFNR